MATDRITIRLGKSLRTACERLAAAAGLDLGEWFRSLAARETGVSGDLKQGLAAVSKRRRKEVSRLGVEARENGSDSD